MQKKIFEIASRYARFLETPITQSTEDDDEQPSIPVGIAVIQYTIETNSIEEIKTDVYRFAAVLSTSIHEYCVECQQTEEAGAIESAFLRFASVTVVIEAKQAQAAPQSTSFKYSYTHVSTLEMGNSNADDKVLSADFTNERFFSEYVRVLNDDSGFEVEPMEEYKELADEFVKAFLAILFRNVGVNLLLDECYENFDNNEYLPMVLTTQELSYKYELMSVLEEDITDEQLEDYVRRRTLRGGAQDHAEGGIGGESGSGGTIGNVRDDLVKYSKIYENLIPYKNIQTYVIDKALGTANPKFDALHQYQWYREDKDLINTYLKHDLPIGLIHDISQLWRNKTLPSNSRSTFDRLLVDAYKLNAEITFTADDFIRLIDEWGYQSKGRHLQYNFLTKRLLKYQMIDVEPIINTGIPFQVFTFPGVYHEESK
jgi:hypothetical protein